MLNLLIFETHSTSTDNEQKIASGHLDPLLSEKGKQQAVEMGIRYQNMPINMIYTSDLKRASQTVEIAFSSRNLQIQKTPLLREWNYGDFNGTSEEIINKMKLNYINNPFPNGESLLDVKKRVEKTLKTISQKLVLIIGHRAVYYILEHLFKRKTLEKIVVESWRWQPGWYYTR